MYTEFTALSREVLEQIALNLSTQQNYHLARTCRILAEVASARPLYQHVHLRLDGPAAQACQQLYNRLERMPHLGRYTRSYQIEGPAIPLSSTSSVPAITANATIAFLLLNRMPRLLSIDLPFFHPRATDARFINERLSTVASIRSLRHVEINGSNGHVTFHMLLPLLRSARLEGLNLSSFEFDIDDIALRPPETQCSGITDLTLDAVKFGESAREARVGVGFRKLLHIFPMLLQLELRSMDHVPPRWIMHTVTRSCPQLRRLAFYDMFIGERHAIHTEDSGFLERLTELEELVGSGRCFTDTSLLQLASTATLVDLTECDLAPTAQAYAVCRWAHDPAIQRRRTVKLKRANGDLTLAIWVRSPSLR